MTHEWVREKGNGLALGAEWVPGSLSTIPACTLRMNRQQVECPQSRDPWSRRGGAGGRGFCKQRRPTVAASMGGDHRSRLETGQRHDSLPAKTYPCQPVAEAEGIALGGGLPVRGRRAGRVGRMRRLQRGGAGAVGGQTRLSKGGRRGPARWAWPGPRLRYGRGVRRPNPRQAGRRGPRQGDAPHAQRARASGFERPLPLGVPPRRAGRARSGHATAHGPAHGRAMARLPRRRTWEGKAGAFGYQDGIDWVHVIEGSESTLSACRWSSWPRCSEAYSGADRHDG